jgi:TetR/AcrR family transcriptional repressor of nem operon
MPWTKEHKSATRTRILDAASAALRRKGVAGVGVAEMMDAAGLTHGGFYSHFRSKDDLVAQAFAYASGQSGARLQAAADKAPDGAKLRAVADTYLTPSHARHPERGCPVSTVGPDLVRGVGEGRAACATAIRERLAWLEDLAEGDTADERRSAAAGTYAAMLGAIFIARALGEEDGDRHLALVRRFLRERVGDT